MSRATKQALLQRAAKLLGEDALAARLRVPRHLLDVWIRGLATMPDRKLLPLADLLDKLADSKKEWPLYGTREGVSSSKKPPKPGKQGT
jgi:hypothetical protein